MPDKLDRCVQHVKNDPEIDNPWAVCNASIDELKAEEPDKLLNELDDITSADATFPSADASYKHTGNMTPTKSDHSYENTSAEENLKEIDDMLSKSATFPTSNSSFKHKTSGLVTRLKPDTFGNTGNETVSIPGSLSAVKIKGKKKEGRSMQETVFKSILDTKLNSCGCSKKKLEINVHKKQIMETKIGEGGPGSGPQPGGGKKQDEPYRKDSEGFPVIQSDNPDDADLTPEDWEVRNKEWRDHATLTLGLNAERGEDYTPQEFADEFGLPLDYSTEVITKLKKDMALG